MQRQNQNQQSAANFQNSQKKNVVAQNKDQNQQKQLPAKPNQNLNQTNQIKQQQQNIVVQKKIKCHWVYLMLMQCKDLANLNEQSKQFQAYRFIEQLSQSKLDSDAIKNLEILDNYLIKLFSVLQDQDQDQSKLLLESFIASSEEGFRKQQEAEDIFISPQAYLTNIEKFKSDFSKLFLFATYNGYWCDQCKQQQLFQKESHYFILRKKAQYNENYESIQQFLNQIFSTNIRGAEKSCACHSLQKANGIIRLPQFLFIFLDDCFINKITIEENIKIFDQILKKDFHYSLKGYVDRDNKYWKKGISEWTQGSFGKSQQASIKNSVLQKGLLYFKEQKEERQRETDKVVEMKQNPIQVDSKVQVVLNYLEKQGYFQLEKTNKDFQYLEFQGVNSKKQKIQVSVFCAPSSEDKQKYDEIEKKIRQYQQKHILQHSHIEQIPETSFYLVFNPLNDVQKLQNFLKEKQNLNENFISNTFRIILEFVEVIENDNLFCHPFLIDQVWINKINMTQILSSQLFPRNLPALKVTNEDKISWLSSLLSSLFQDRISKEHETLKLSLTKRFSFLEQEQDSSSQKIQKKYENLKDDTNNKQTIVRECLNNSNLKETFIFPINKELKRKEFNSYSDLLSRRAYDQMINERETKVCYESIIEALPTLKEHGYVATQFLGFRNTAITMLADSSNQKYAIKLIDCKSPQDKLNCLNQVSLMRLAESPNIIHLKEHFLNPQNESQFFIITQFYERGTLEQYLNNNQNASKSSINKLAFGILTGTKTLHDKGIIHGSLCPQNILLITENEPVISGFESANSVSKNSLDASKKEMNINYSPLELYQENSRMTYESDTFSLGMVLYALCQPQTDQTLNIIMQMRRGEFPDFSNHPFSDLLEISKRMMAPQPDQRLNISKALFELQKIC